MKAGLKFKPATQLRHCDLGSAPPLKASSYSFAPHFQPHTKFSYSHMHWLGSQAPRPPHSPHTQRPSMLRDGAGSCGAASIMHGATKHLQVSQFSPTSSSTMTAASEVCVNPAHGELPISPPLGFKWPQQGERSFFLFWFDVLLYHPLTGLCSPWKLNNNSVSGNENKDNFKPLRYFL